MSIETYIPRTASYHPYDASCPAVAERLASLITTAGPSLRVEHIGSTSVPGCGGKGIIDLMILYSPGQLETARSTLTRLGFQPQSGRDPFPETRPMRVGAIRYRDKMYRIHVHVIAADSVEAAELRRFRDWLRGDSKRVAAYTDRKVAILASGVVDSVDYCAAKEEFIRSAL